MTKKVTIPKFDFKIPNGLPKNNPGRGDIGTNSMPKFVAPPPPPPRPKKD